MYIHINIYVFGWLRIIVNSLPFFVGLAKPKPPKETEQNMTQNVMGGRIGVFGLLNINTERSYGEHSKTTQNEQVKRNLLL